MNVLVIVKAKKGKKNDRKANGAARQTGNEEPKFEIKHIGPHQYIIERLWRGKTHFVVRNPKTHEISLTGREFGATKFPIFCDAEATLRKIKGNDSLKYM